jgi:hypothetical protein
MEFGEQIFYIPLGESKHLIPSIEIVITVKRNENTNPTNPRRNSNPGNGR